jgi:hypothetical protein
MNINDGENVNIPNAKIIKDRIVKDLVSDTDKFRKAIIKRIQKMVQNKNLNSQFLSVIRMIHLEMLEPSW